MKGICFIPPLHDKTVEGMKTQTRRLIVSRTGFFQVCSKNGIVTNIWQTDADEWTGENLIPVKPRYNVGEIVYLKEPYAILPDNSIVSIAYKFGYPENLKEQIGAWKSNSIPNVSNINWKNKLFMPASAARSFIKITAIKVERLQDISDEDCIKEGIGLAKRSGFVPGGMAYDVSEEWDYTYACAAWTPQDAYASLIDKINGKGTWDSNPWVWVYEYILVDRKEVQL
jgi:hypothetical protein